MGGPSTGGSAESDRGAAEGADVVWLGAGCGEDTDSSVGGARSEVAGVVLEAGSAALGLARGTLEQVCRCASRPL